VDVAIVDSAVYARVAARAPQVTAKLVTLWTSPLLANDPLVWRKNLPPEQKAKIAAFVLAYGKGEGPEAETERAVLKKLGFLGFVSADDRHLDQTRALRAWSRLIEARRTNEPSQITAAEAAVAGINSQSLQPAAP
jgi:phosphonate transport system substrate-binding protein